MSDLARQVPVASHVADYVARLVIATHADSESAPPTVRRFVRYGSSPRGGQAMVLGAKIRALIEGRYNVAFEDVEAVAAASLRHRLLLNFEGLAEGVLPDTIIAELLETVPQD
jgi:MoxR-like ATPase